jgi:hypothetical protein
MLTPTGKECRYFYGDYHRGRKNEECRLLNPANLIWSPYLCEKCPIPDILLANACENIEYSPKLEKPFFFMKPQVRISAFCVKSNASVNEPRIGCGQCHPINNLFAITPDEPDSSV